MKLDVIIFCYRCNVERKNWVFLTSLLVSGKFSIIYNIIFLYIICNIDYFLYKYDHNEKVPSSFLWFERYVL